MFKKIPVLFSVILLCLTLSFSSVFALDFEKLPAGVDVTVIPDNHTVIQTGETDNGIVYVVSAKLKNNTDGANLSPYIDSEIYITGYDKTNQTVAYFATYTQPGSYCKISTKSKNYFYYVRLNTTTSKHEVVKVDLSTSAIVKTLNGTIGTSGVVVNDNGESMAVKYIAVNEKDEVFILGRRTDTSTNKIVKWGSVIWTNFCTADYPSTPGSTGTSNGLCASVDS